MLSAVLLFFLSIFTGSLIYEHYTRECEFENFDKIKNKKHKKTKQHKKNTKTKFNLKLFKKKKNGGHLKPGNTINGYNIKFTRKPISMQQ